MALTPNTEHAEPGDRADARTALPAALVALGSGHWPWHGGTDVWHLPAVPQPRGTHSKNQSTSPATSESWQERLYSVCSCTCGTRE